MKKPEPKSKESRRKNTSLDTSSNTSPNPSPIPNPIEAESGEKPVQSTLPFLEKSYMPSVVASTIKYEERSTRSAKAFNGQRWFLQGSEVIRYLTWLQVEPLNLSPT